MKKFHKESNSQCIAQYSFLFSIFVSPSNFLSDRPFSFIFRSFIYSRYTYKHQREYCTIIKSRTEISNVKSYMLTAADLLHSSSENLWLIYRNKIKNTYVDNVRVFYAFLRTCVRRISYLLKIFGKFNIESRISKAPLK